MYSLKVLEPTGLAVTEAKSVDEDKTFQDHIPQAVGEMFACAKALGSVPLPRRFNLYSSPLK